jgi:predicted nucleic acid-binding protein
MIDTSVMVAALIANHEHHRLARPNLSSATRVPAIVLAETYAQLRRTFGQPASAAVRLLAPWTRDRSRVLPTTSAAVTSVFGKAIELDLGGNIHDALIAQTCIQHRVSLATLDRRQHRIAMALGAQSRYLLTD